MSPNPLMCLWVQILCLLRPRWSCSMFFGPDLRRVWVGSKRQYVGRRLPRLSHYPRPGQYSRTVSILRRISAAVLLGLAIALGAVAIALVHASTGY